MALSSTRVSVVLSVYNGMPLLPEAIESILAQTYPDFDLLLINDGSTDDSGAVCDAAAQRDARVRVVHQPNAGIAASLNRGISETEGKYVAIMDADDRSYPERIERQVAFLDAHPEIGVVGCQADCFDGHAWSVWGESSTPVEIRWDLLFTTPMAHSAAMMRRSVLRDVSGYDEELTSLQDYDLFYRISRTYDIVNLEDRLFYVDRTSSTNDSTVNWSRQFDTGLVVHRAVFHDYGVPLPEKHARAISGCFFASPDQAEAVIGRLSKADLNAVGRAQSRLARAFLQRWKPDDSARLEIESNLRWRSHRLEQALVARGTSSAVARAMRLSWDVPTAVRRVARRLLPHPR